MTKDKNNLSVQQIKNKIVTLPLTPGGMV